MSGYQIPIRPEAVRASELLHGDVDGFIVNAYLALQRHWPDDGGFHHYKYLLSQSPEQRPEVLRVLAASETARHIGAQFDDDLPAGYLYDPEIESTAQARARYETTSQRFRLAQVIHDARATREALSGLTLDALSEVVQTLVSQNRDTLALLDSRVASVEAGAESMRDTLLATPQPASVELAWMRQELARLNARVMTLESEQAGSARREDTVLAAEFSVIKDGFESLHRYTTIDLKRQVADYVIAYVDARAVASAVTPPTASNES